MKKTHEENKRIELLVNQNHGLENMHQNLPKRQSQKVFNYKNKHMFNQISTNFQGNL